ncbi:PQQ-dependent sugar dehydrogenase [Lacimicrobium sp. SS2-24]|uniref:PQQ-dependent sugar dehydrogenase n=1 Tax=Lacimicrobium sp. SS2-24 TaxID=2005569 RepID=UPI000B4BE413|nr:PQQ-dependent sugar dehydrogenase [Lacimicrobium sp. SS2-24]
MTRKFALLLASLTLGLSTAACANTPAQLDTEQTRIKVDVVTSGLQHPWGMTFLPDGRMLVTERTGTLRVVDEQGNKSAPLTGLPDILAKNQGGLLDVTIDPMFSENQRIYFSFSEPAKDGDKTSTAVASAILEEDGLTALQVIFSANPKIDTGHHFGSRLVFDRTGALFITLGDRGSQRDGAQQLTSHYGKVVRVLPNGQVPADNPYVNNDAALSDIWSYGHRNVQGAALNPYTGELWTHEHGPQGGDEINITRAGKNYGWPEITYGEEYGGGEIGDTEKAGMEQPLHYWVPSIAPSGMAFYTANAFADWKGNLLVGSLKFRQLVRLTLDKQNKVSHEERIDIGQRVRDVRQGPDGAVYLLTDHPDGQILRLSPSN